jgi:hypothetical protein
VVPWVRPVIVLLVAGALAVMGASAVVPTYGVILYAVGAPPVVGAFQRTSAEVLPASAAVTLLTAPAAGVGVNWTSTQ